MSFVNALSLVLCVIGGLLTYLCLGPLAGYIHIWAIFVFTATGVALGGSNEAFKNLVVCAFAGIIIAWIGSMIVLNVPLAATLTLPVWAAIVVGVTTGCLAFIANIKLFPAIPATVIGYALTFAYLLQGDAKRLTTENLVTIGPSNPLVCMTLSLLVRSRVRYRRPQVGDDLVVALRCNGPGRISFRSLPC